MRVLKRLLAFGTALSLLVGMTPTAVFAKDSTIALTGATQNTQSTTTSQSNDTQEEYVTHTGSDSVISTGSWWNQEKITMSELVGNTDPSTITKIVFETDTDCGIDYKGTEEYEGSDGELTRWTQKNLTAGENLEVDDIWFDIDNWGTEKCGSYFFLVTSSGDEFTANVTWTVYATKSEDTTKKVDHIELYKATSDKLVKDYDGFYEKDSDGNMYFYDLGWDMSDAQIKIVYDNGSTEIANVGDEVDGYSVHLKGIEYEDPWTLGENIAIISYMGYKVLMTVNVVIANSDFGIDHIEVYKATDFVCVENYDGCYKTDSDGNKYFHYYISSKDIEDTQIKLVYYDDQFDIVNVGDEVCGYYIDCETNQNKNHWTVGDDNEVVITFAGFKVTMNISVVESRVDHIELYKPTEFEYIENTHGSTRKDPNTGEYFFEYDEYTFGIDENGYENITYYVADAQIKIVYDDGTYVISNICTSVDGYYIGIAYEPQSSKNPWTVGEHEATISYLNEIDNYGVESSDNFNIVSNLKAGETYCLEVRIWNDRGGEFDVTVEKLKDVDHIELVKSTETTWIENSDEDGYEEIDNDGNKYFYYRAYERNLDDSQIKIYYKDGTTKIANVGNIVGYSYVTVAINQEEKHWTLGDDNEVIISYLGHEVTMYVSVVECPVDHIELYKATEFKLIENYDGYEKTDSNGNEFYYYSVYRGSIDDAQIKIVYKDGTSVIANAGDEVNGYYIDYYHNQYSDHWTLGDDNKIIITYLGKEVTMNVSVIENPVDHIELYKASSYKFVENSNGCFYTDINDEEYFDYYTDNGDEDYLSDAQIKIYYKDGTTKIVNIGDMIDGHYVYTIDNQYTEHWVVGDQNEIAIKYMNFEVTMYVSVVEKSEGTADITMDGKIDAQDRTMLARYIAGWLSEEELESLNVSAMDLNNDGKVDAKDRTILARHIAEWEGYKKLPLVEE